jgi:ACS family D-galactonate transporter-like MFS transporter
MDKGAAGTVLAPEVTRRAALPTNSRYGVILLCGAMIAINFFDRYNLAAAVPTLMKEFGFSPARMGMLMSAYSWAWVVCVIPIGYLLNRKSPKMIGFFACLGWGLVTLFTAVVSGLYSFLAVRLALGATESAGYPTCTRIASAWTPKHERTTFTGIFDGCAKLGSAFSPPLVVWAIIHWGWRSSFVISGLVAVVFAFLWLRYYYDPDKHPKISKEELDYIRHGQIIAGVTPAIKTKEIPMYKLLTYPRIFFMCCGFFLYNYFVMVFHLWIPAYLIQAKGFTLHRMGFAVAYPFMAAFAVELIGARFLDKALERGVSLNKVRRTGQLIGYWGSAACLYMAVVAPAGMTVFWLTVTYAVLSIGGAQNWAITSELAPPGQVGTVSALNSVAGALSGITAPWLTGLFIQTRWGYNGALFVVVGAAVAAGLVYGLLDYSKPIIPRPV